MVPLLLASAAFLDAGEEDGKSHRRGDRRQEKEKHKKLKERFEYEDRVHRRRRNEFDDDADSYR